MNRRRFLYFIVYTALFALFTLLFTLVNYPSGRLTDQVNGWVQSASHGSLSVERARFRFPLSLRLDGITLHLDQGPMGFGEAVVGPRLLGLLSGKRAADVHLENPWLDTSLTFHAGAESWELEVHSMDMDLSGLPEGMLGVPLQMKGRIGVSLSLLSVDTSSGIASGGISVTSGPLSAGGDLLAALGLDSLNISSVSAVATVEENVVTLGENAVEGDLTASARGQLRLAQGDYMASRLDLMVDVRPDPGIRERLIPVFRLMGSRPRADGSVKFRVRGTLGKPVVTM